MGTSRRQRVVRQRLFWLELGLVTLPSLLSRIVRLLICRYTAASTNGDEPRAARPIRQTKPTAALLEHSERAALPSQTKAINEFRTAEAARSANEIRHTATPGPSLVPSVPQQVQPAASTSSSKCPISDDDIDECENVRTNPKPKKAHKAAARTDSDSVGEDGILTLKNFLVPHLITLGLMAKSRSTASARFARENVYLSTRRPHSIDMQRLTLRASIIHG
ncbi:hypothetical protein DFH29DRAFT_900637 [Suillus ampliporus]|nr:hypothetical protein DFH29DRAFT_900637 [Suillus ampliporus]